MDCFFSQGETELLTLFQNGEDILPLMHHNIHIKEKELGGQFSSNGETVEANTSLTEV
jgi:GTP 3',8-cyclase